MSKFRRVQPHGRNNARGRSVHISELQLQPINPRDLERLRRSGRVAYRHEGDFWNAYYALPDTMKGAIFIGCIRIKAIEGNDLRRQQFMDMMWETVRDTLREAKAVELVRGDEEPAPEHERENHDKPEQIN